MLMTGLIHVQILVDCSGDDGEEKNPDTAFQNKKSALLQLVDESSVPKTIVFCNKASSLSLSLNLSLSPLHTHTHAHAHVRMNAHAHLPPACAFLFLPLLILENIN